MFVFLSFFKTEFSMVNANNVRFFFDFPDKIFPVFNVFLKILESGKHYPISQFKLIYA